MTLYHDVLVEVLFFFPLSLTVKFIALHTRMQGIIVQLLIDVNVG